MPAQHRHPVVALLSEHFRLVAGGAEFKEGKVVVFAFYFLYQNDVGRRFGKPCGQVFDPGVNRVQVVGGNFHKFIPLLFDLL